MSESEPPLREAVSEGRLRAAEQFSAMKSLLRFSPVFECRLHAILPVLPIGVIRVVVAYLPSPTQRLFVAVRRVEQRMEIGVEMPESKRVVVIGPQNGQRFEYECDVALFRDMPPGLRLADVDKIEAKCSSTEEWERAYEAALRAAARKLTMQQPPAPYASQTGCWFALGMPELILEHLLGHGGSAVLFTVGPRGSGKTFAMRGVHGEPQLAGLIDRAAQLLFRRLELAELEETARKRVGGAVGPAGVDPLLGATVRVSAMDSYREELQDLVAGPVQGTLRELHNLVQVTARSAEEVSGHVMEGCKRRAVRQTTMGEVSRSCFAVRISVELRGASQPAELVFVDMCGLEQPAPPRFETPKFRALSYKCMNAVASILKELRARRDAAAPWPLASTTSSAAADSKESTSCAAVSSAAVSAGSAAVAAFPPKAGLLDRSRPVPQLPPLGKLPPIGKPAESPPSQSQSKLSEPKAETKSSSPKAAAAAAAVPAPQQRQSLYTRDPALALPQARGSKLTNLLRPLLERHDTRVLVCACLAPSMHYWQDNLDAMRACGAVELSKAEAKES